MAGQMNDGPPTAAPMDALDYALAGDSAGGGMADVSQDDVALDVDPFACIG